LVIIGDILSVLPTVNFDDQLLFDANEVGDIFRQWVLASEFVSRHLAHPQMSPEPPLSIGHATA